MKDLTIWVAIYNNMDGEAEVVAASLSVEDLQQELVKRIEEYVSRASDVAYKRIQNGDNIGYLVGDKVYSDDDGSELDLEPFEWYTLTRVPVV